MSKSKWVKIPESTQPRAKSWVIAEWVNESLNPPQTILVWEEDKRFKIKYGNFRIWTGNTDGSNYGRYFNRKTKSGALAFARKIIAGRI